MRSGLGKNIVERLRFLTQSRGVPSGAKKAIWEAAVSLGSLRFPYFTSARWSSVVGSQQKAWNWLNNYLLPPNSLNPKWDGDLLSDFVRPIRYIKLEDPESSKTPIRIDTIYYIPGIAHAIARYFYLNYDVSEDGRRRAFNDLQTRGFLQEVNARPVFGDVANQVTVFSDGFRDSLRAVVEESRGKDIGSELASRVLKWIPTRGESQDVELVLPIGEGCHFRLRVEIPTGRHCLDPNFELDSGIPGQHDVFARIPEEGQLRLGRVWHDGANTIHSRFAYTPMEIDAYWLEHDLRMAVPFESQALEYSRPDYESGFYKTSLYVSALTLLEHLRPSVQPERVDSRLITTLRRQTGRQLSQTQTGPRAKILVPMPRVGDYVDLHLIRKLPTFRHIRIQGIRESVGIVRFDDLGFCDEKPAADTNQAGDNSRLRPTSLSERTNRTRDLLDNELRRRSD